MTPRIILPADTTVTVGDTLWWGVEGVCIHEPHDHPPDHFDPAGCDTVPPEWQALTEACATCGDDFGWAPGWRSTEPFAETPERCPDCHEGRRTVEVAGACCSNPQTCRDFSRPHCSWRTDDTADGRVPLGRAVIDGDWVPIVDWKDQHAIATLDRFISTGWEGDPSWFGLYTRGTHLGRKLERITLHGYADPGGYAARFEVIA